jgi:hypothetical protein
LTCGLLSNRKFVIKTHVDILRGSQIFGFSKSGISARLAARSKGDEIQVNKRRNKALSPSFLELPARLSEFGVISSHSQNEKQMLE